MKRDLMDILVCPMCRGTLELTVDREEQEEIIEGNLRCQSCEEEYPIRNTIPNLLPPSLRLEE